MPLRQRLVTLSEKYRTRRLSVIFLMVNHTELIPWLKSSTCRIFFKQQRIDNGFMFFPVFPTLHDISFPLRCYRIISTKAAAFRFFILVEVFFVTQPMDTPIYSAIGNRDHLFHVLAQKISIDIILGNRQEDNHFKHRRFHGCTVHSTTDPNSKMSVAISLNVSRWVARITSVFFEILVNISLITCSFSLSIAVSISSKRRILGR